MKGFTLLELMLAVILLGIVIYAANTAELVGRTFFNTDLAKSVLVRNASYAVSEIAKMIRMGGSIRIYNGGRRVEIDIPDPTPQNRATVIYYLQEGKLFADNPYLGVLVGATPAEKEQFRFQGSMIETPDILVKAFNISRSGDIYTISLTLEDTKRDQEVTFITRARPQNI